MSPKYVDWDQTGRTAAVTSMRVCRETHEAIGVSIVPACAQIIALALCRSHLALGNLIRAQTKAGGPSPDRPLVAEPPLNALIHRTSDVVHHVAYLATHCPHRDDSGNRDQRSDQRVLDGRGTKVVDHQTAKDRKHVTISELESSPKEQTQPYFGKADHGRIGGGKRLN
jgi:hypothetical protein